MLHFVVTHSPGPRSNTYIIDRHIIKSYNFRFWKEVTKTKLIEDALTEAVLDVINRLNFETDIFEAVINEKSEIIQETLVSSLSQAIIMEEMPLASDGN